MNITCSIDDILISEYKKIDKHQHVRCNVRAFNKHVSPQVRNFTGGTNQYNIHPDLKYPMLDRYRNDWYE